MDRALIHSCPLKAHHFWSADHLPLNTLFLQDPGAAPGQKWIYQTLSHFCVQVGVVVREKEAEIPKGEGGRQQRGRLWLRMQVLGLKLGPSTPLIYLPGHLPYKDPLELWGGDLPLGTEGEKVKCQR